MSNSTADQAGNNQNNVTIIGGYGKVGLLTAPLLVGEGNVVRSVIRKDEQSAAVAEIGGGDWERACAVDRDAAICSMTAAMEAGGQPLHHGQLAGVGQEPRGG